ncbi:MAG: uroporphyrinogen III synthase [Sideroxydans sp. GWF2_59_14]|nr:MAG: uroporphyrinogen III synthase [Sideroxydans sp. GWF2_59_14]HAF43960.1 uroporphyrinogen III synthase [Gallionellaceae bacterium]
MAELPLAGLNIVVTRPRDQAVELLRHIECLGGKALLFPLLEIEAVPDAQALRQQLTLLKQADLAIFISPNAVRYGMAAIEAAGGVPAMLKVATVGQGSAKALHELGVTRVIVPAERFDSEGLLALPELQNIAGKRVMILRGDSGRELLGDTLKARGATVEYVSCYLRRKHPVDGVALLAAKPAAITVTSSEALVHLWASLQEAARTALAAMPLFVPHARIAELARQQGWTNITVAASGDDGLIAGLVAWANKERS